MTGRSRTGSCVLGLLGLVVACGRVGFGPETEPADASPSPITCPAGSPSAWTIAAGYRATVMTEALDEPTGVTFAGGEFGDRLYVANNGNTTVTAIDPATGASTLFVSTAGWPLQPTRLTAITWDEHGIFDGSLYLADRGTSSDSDAAIYAIEPSTATRVLALGPGPALDDVYSLAFVSDPSYGTGLMVAGDTEVSTSIDWARYDQEGVATPFSQISGISGIAVDASGAYGGGVFASRPSNESFDGSDTIAKLSSNGTIAGTLVTDQSDVHALVQAPPGAFHGWMYAATLRSVIGIDPAGAVVSIVTNGDFDESDGNIIAFSADGHAMYVVSRSSDQLVCIEPGKNPGGAPDAAPPPGG